MTLSKIVQRVDRKSMLSAFRFGAELVGKVPAKGDGPLAIIAKALAIGDAWNIVYGGKKSVYTDIFTRYQLRERTSDPFVKLFFGAGLALNYRVSRIGVSDYLEMIEAVAPDGERLFFQEHRYGRPEVSAEFFHTPGFDFAGALAEMWGMHPSGLYLSLAPRSGGPGHELAFAGLDPDTTACRSRKAGERITRVADSLVASPRTLLLHGPPGTGKTSLAAGVAKLCGGRLLAIDAAALPSVSAADLGFWLDALEPRHLLIDDLDGAPMEEARTRLRLLFQRISARKITCFVAVNDVSKVDAALLRSGRIDDAIELPLPDDDERRDILARGGLDAGLWIETGGWCHADLDALAFRAACGEQVADVLAGMKRLRALAQQATAATPAGAPGEPPTGGKA